MYLKTYLSNTPNTVDPDHGLFKSSQNIFIQEIHIHIKYIEKTEAQWGLFVPSVSEFSKIYNNLFVDQQTEQSNKGVSIGVHFKNKCHLWVH